MHDFGCSRKYAILLNLPLTLSPMNLVSWKPKPMIHFDRTLPSEFILFPRNGTAPARFIDREPSMIFHTANAWDDVDSDTGEETVEMVACRFRSAKLVYAAGAMPVPAEEFRAGIDDVVRLHYYRFLFSNDADDPHQISHCFPLSEIPCEFPTCHPQRLMGKARYIYVCSMKEGGFDERLGGAAKVDCLVKADVLDLSRRGKRRGKGKGSAVDKRTVMEIIRQQEALPAGHEPTGEDAAMQVFALPEGWYAQECRFVPKQGVDLEEDDGYLVTYGKCLPSAGTRR
jgi:carotenoid cleavage dioxygenase-like enzyme